MTDVPEELRSAVEAVDRGFSQAFARGDVEGAVRSTYTEDAVILPPGSAAVRGRESIAGFWRVAADAMGIERVDLATRQLTPAGDHAYQIGDAVLGLRGGTQAHMKYVVIWKRDDGRWRWHVDIWNADEQLQEAAPGSEAQQ